MGLMKQSAKLSSFFLYLIVSFGVTWLAWLPGILQHRSIFSISMPLTLLGGMGPAVAAVVVMAVTEGRSGLLWLVRRVIRWRVPLRWYLAALLLPLIGAVAAMTAQWALTGRFPGFMLPQADGPGGLLLGLLSAFVLQTVLTGGNEELGWRGYALPALQTRLGAVASSLVLAAIWAVWHLPLFFMAGTFHSQTSFWVFLLFTLPLTLLFTWLSNRTGESILLVMLFHGAFNTTAGLVRISFVDPPLIVTYLLIAAVATASSWSSRGRPSVRAGRSA